MKYIFSFLLTLFSSTLLAQELDCTVTINTGSLKTSATSNQQVFAEMKTAISDFMNNRRWTNDVFASEEKIKCNLIINLIQASEQFDYQSTFQFQVIRPVYGTTYETMLLNLVDGSVSFSFRNEDRQMIFNENNYNNSLTSTLAFYSLMAIGLDYDSFAKLGGTPFFQRAINVSTLEQNAINFSNDPCKTTRSRFCMAFTFNSSQIAAFREALYNYHRLGLDVLTTDPAKGRKNVFDILAVIKQLQGTRQNLGLLDSFMDAKNEEFIGVLGESDPADKQKAFNLLSQIDPAKTERYRELVK